MSEPASALLMLIEKALNQVLEQDQQVHQRLTELPRSVLCIEVTGIDYRVYLHLGINGILLSHSYAGEVQVTVRGRALALLRLTRAEQRHQALSARDVEIIGDLGLVQQLQQVFAGLDIDWEAWLSQYLGDIPAHQLGRAGRGSARWFKHSQQTFEQNLSEYLQYETRLLADRDSINELLTGIDELHADVERLEARIRQLQVSS